MNTMRAEMNSTKESDVIERRSYFAAFGLYRESRGGNPEYGVISPSLVSLRRFASRNKDILGLFYPNPIGGIRFNW